MEKKPRGLEDEYFHRLDADRIEKSREEARREGLKNILAERVGATDPEVLELLLEMGLDRETAPVVPLLPLVQVAWADGEVSEKERAAIRKVARTKQIAEGSPADELLTKVLETRPSERFFADALLALKDVLASLPEDERNKRGHGFAAAVEEIASVSGGLFGFGTVSSEEREVIRKVAAELEKAHEAAAKKVMTSI
jgi:tellurite resistance protein